MSNEGTTQLTWQTEGKCKVGRLQRQLGEGTWPILLQFVFVVVQLYIFLQIVNFVVPTLDMAYPSPSCLCSRPNLHFPSVCHVNFVVPPLDMTYPSPSCL
jgi:hypothetical protein